MMSSVEITNLSRNYYHKLTVTITKLRIGGRWSEERYLNPLKMIEFNRKVPREDREATQDNISIQKSYCCDNDI
jgi:hypothetical protein